MPAALIKRLSNLLCVKSIVTLILSGQLEKDTGQKSS